MRLRRPSSFALACLATSVCMTASACGGNGSTSGPPDPTTGTLQVNASTSGDTLDVDGYAVTLDGGDERSLAPDGTVTFHDVAEGSHEVAISGVQANCSPDGDGTRAPTVTAGQTTTVTFSVSCAAAWLDRIVFSSRREGGEFDLHVMRTDGTGVVQITDDDAFDNDPDITGDGTQLVFASGTDISVMGADGTGRNDYAGPSGQDFDTAWSPDGSRIVFWNFTGEIWVMEADGSGLTQLTDNDDSDRRPAWSADGSRIAFDSDRSGAFEIWVMDSDGSNPVQLTASPSSDDFEPAWSPVGDRIAFVSDRDESDNFDIYTMASDGTDIRRITTHPAEDGTPRWSPDGERIVFWSFRDGNTEIYSVAADGSDLRRLTDHPETDADPVWTPARD